MPIINKLPIQINREAEIRGEVDEYLVVGDDINIGDYISFVTNDNDDILVQLAKNSYNVDGIAVTAGKESDYIQVKYVYDSGSEFDRIINQTIEEYKAGVGENINAGDFVKFVNEKINTDVSVDMSDNYRHTSYTSSYTYAINVYDNNIIIIYIDDDSYATAKIVTVNTNYNSIVSHDSTKLSIFSESKISTIPVSPVVLNDANNNICIIVPLKTVDNNTYFCTLTYYPDTDVGSLTCTTGQFNISDDIDIVALDILTSNKLFVEYTENAGHSNMHMTLLLDNTNSIYDSIISTYSYSHQPGVRSCQLASGQIITISCDMHDNVCVRLYTINDNYEIYSSSYVSIEHDTIAFDINDIHMIAMSSNIVCISYRLQSGAYGITVLDIVGNSIVEAYNKTLIIQDTILNGSISCIYQPVLLNNNKILSICKVKTTDGNYYRYDLISVDNLYGTIINIDTVYSSKHNNIFNTYVSQLNNSQVAVLCNCDGPDYTYLQILSITDNNSIRISSKYNTYLHADNMTNFNNQALVNLNDNNVFITYMYSGSTDGGIWLQSAKIINNDIYEDRVYKSLDNTEIQGIAYTSATPDNTISVITPKI